MTKPDIWQAILIVLFDSLYRSVKNTSSLHIYGFCFKQCLNNKDVDINVYSVVIHDDIINLKNNFLK